ncbi:alanine racemase [Petroclostridium sp. X23]|uniref:alanine racemase n=1 Tax=Petroclostridium sp. X23 TaxID=3045146 RepID=UPI0024ADBE72|nr:alanine racemase [Petroclostridium sp. X23]WHH58096.1 alanine racemase [Petroclostridium sp. X23]
MMKFLKRTWAEINLDNIAHNIKEIRKITSESAEIMAVTKADAYGHGFLEVSKTLLENGADRLAVALLDEAKQLRAHGIHVPIMILGYTPEQYADELVELDIIQTVYNYPMAQAISMAASKQRKKSRVHIKLNTGMTRIGFDSSNDAVSTVLNISRLPGIEIEGIFTHFASADEKDADYTRLQFERFMSVCNRLEKNGLHIPIKHVCNSAGIIQFPEMHLDMVRPGIILYGLYPSDEVDEKKIDLKPAMELKSVISHLQEVESNVPVSYGRVYKTARKSTLATIPVGYADGFSRVLTGKAAMIASGKTVPVVGRICMDQCMIDVTDVNNINIGDEVVIFGSSNGINISIDDVAKALGTINYEIVCMIGKRVPRVYIKNGEVVEVLNYLI